MARAAPDLHLDHLRAAMESLADGVALVDAGSLHCLYINDAGLRMLGGQPLRLADSMRAWCDEAVAQSPTPVAETREMRSGDGTRRWLEIRRCATMAAGRWLVTATIRDVTQQKSQNTRLERYRTALDQAGDAILLIDPQRLEYVDVNDAAARMFGMSQDALLADGPLGLRSRAQDAESGESVTDFLRARYAEVIAASPQVVVANVVIRRPDGVLITLEGTRRAFRSEGQWLIVAVLRDITDRIAAQDRLELFQLAMDNSVDALTIVDRTSMRYLAANQTAVHWSGLTHEQYLALDPHVRAWPGATRAELEAEYDEAIAISPRPRVATVTRQRPDGSAFPTEHTRIALEMNGRWVVVSSVRDISERMAAQRRLHVLDAAVNQAADAIIVVDPRALTYIDVNEAAAHMMGARREEMLRLGPVGFGGLMNLRADRAELTAMYANVIDRHPETVVEFRHVRTRDGRDLVLEGTRRAVRVDDAWLVVSVIRDVTERHNATWQLELFRKALDHSIDALVIVDRETMRVVDANQRAFDWAGLTREQYLAQEPHVRAGRGATRESIAAAYDEIIAMAPKPHVSIGEHTRGDGTTFPAERVRTAVQLDGHWTILVSTRDITERLEAQRKLQLLSAAINDAPDGIVVIEPTSLTYVDVNESAARVMGVTREEMTRLGPVAFAERMSLDARPEAMRAAYQALIDRYPEAETTSARVGRRGGKTYYHEVMRRAVRSGGAWLIIVVQRDITERHAATQRHERLSAAINEAEDGIHVVDVQSMIYADANRAAARIFGMTRDEMIALGPIGVARQVEGLAEQAVRDRYQEAITCAPDAVSGMRDLRGADGKTRTIEYTRRALRPDDRWVVVTVARDVTERMAGQRRLAQLEAAIDQAADAILVIDPETLTYLHINKTCEQLLGLSRERMQQLGVGGVVRELGIGSAEDTRRIYRELIDMHPRALTTQRKFTRPDGTTVDEESTRRAVQVDGRWLILLVSRDVTQRLALQQRLEQLRAAVNEATDMVMVIDPQAMEYVEVNEAAARDYGYSREAMLRMGLRRVISSLNTRTYGEVVRYYAELIAQHPAASTELSNVVVEGQAEKIIESTRRAVQMEGQWLIITVGRDVTARERAKHELHQRVEELARSNRDLEQFAYVTSHDLSEPLRMVASYTQLLARRYGTHFDDDGREFMGYVVTGAQRMKQLIDDLLLYSRAGRSATELKEVSLDKALDAALANLAHTIRDSAASIDRPAALPTLACDKTGMTQLFQNLVANAIKFRGEAPPAIRIDALRDGQDWIFSVTDNGIGIEPQYFERIFVIFQRLHARADYEGTGIGLAICKRIVERHDGTMWVESTPGEGCSFKFKLAAKS